LTTSALIEDAIIVFPFFRLSIKAAVRLQIVRRSFITCASGLESTAACDLVRRSPAWQSLGIITTGSFNGNTLGFNWLKKQYQSGPEA